MTSQYIIESLETQADYSTGQRRRLLKRLIKELIKFWNGIESPALIACQRVSRADQNVKTPFMIYRRNRNDEGEMIFAENQDVALGIARERYRQEHPIITDCWDV